ncbi:MAG: sporulation protein YqfD [Romboutsia sp.]|uniref:sporulation protein YqfD n=1 Tax=Romboutsia sp. TaxID=1965302 RepID=UPI003F2DA470
MISYIRGYYIITVEGIGLEKFLNHLIRNNIRIYNVNRTSNTKIEFCIDRQDMKVFKQAYRGSNYDIKVKQKTGVPFFLKRIYKLKGMWICAFISLFLLMMTSMFVTDVYIQVPEGIKKEEVRKELYNVGLKPGVYKKNIDRKEIRDHMMLKFDDIAYISINVKGTNIFVTVTKKAETLESKEQSNYCNIIAEKNGIIEKVIPRSGNQIADVGKIVQKGEVLVSGANTKSVPEVWASTFYEVSKSENYEDTIKEKTGNKKRVYTINFYDKKYTLRKNIKYEDYSVENKDYKISLGNYTFPVKIKVSTFHETKDVKIKKDKEKLKKELSEQALKELEYIIPASARFVNVEHDYKVNKNMMLEYTITAQMSENIAKIDNLSKAEAEQLIREENTPKDGEEAVPQNPDKRPINDIRNEFKEKEDKKEDKKDT